MRDDFLTDLQVSDFEISSPFEPKQREICPDRRDLRGNLCGNVPSPHRAPHSRLQEPLPDLQAGVHRTDADDPIWDGLVEFGLFDMTTRTPQWTLLGQRYRTDQAGHSRLVVGVLA